MKMTAKTTMYAIINCGRRSVEFVCDATDGEHAIAQALEARGRAGDRPPLSWGAEPVSTLPDDLRAESLAWTAEGR